uniref:Secreted protein n=1 Tax=Aegilops tauschii subsp. strangulata TaxID=200361 RepID=A0A453B551_AEGTS
MLLLSLSSLFSFMLVKPRSLSVTRCSFLLPMYCKPIVRDVRGTETFELQQNFLPIPDSKLSC